MRRLASLNLRLVLLSGKKLNDFIAEREIYWQKKRWVEKKKHKEAQINLHRMKILLIIT